MNSLQSDVPSPRPPHTAPFRMIVTRQQRRAARIIVSHIDAQLNADIAAAVIAGNGEVPKTD